MKWLLSKYPFNAEQTVNIVGEFGPLVALFVVNAMAGVIAGTWALIVATALAMVAMMVVLGRLPIFPLIASGVTVAFGILTLLTGDPMWIQIKVTIFNIMFAIFLCWWALAGQELLQVHLREDLPLHKGRLGPIHVELCLVLCFHGHSERSRAARLSQGRDV